MVNFDNIFDAAISRADDAILDAMASPIQITVGAMAGKTISGVFDDPESISYPGNGVRIEGTMPTIFIKTSLVSQLQRTDTITINGESFWVDRIGPDDSGSCHVMLGRGAPPSSNRRR